MNHGLSRRLPSTSPYHGGTSWIITVFSNTRLGQHACSQRDIPKLSPASRTSPEFVTTALLGYVLFKVFLRSHWRPGPGNQRCLAHMAFLFKSSGQALSCLLSMFLLPPRSGVGGSGDPASPGHTRTPCSIINRCPGLVSLGILWRSDPSLLPLTFILHLGCCGELDCVPLKDLSQS